MVFVRGTLVSGANDLRRLIDRGELQTMLQA
jgi:glutaredoxin-related protein